MIGSESPHCEKRVMKLRLIQPEVTHHCVVDIGGPNPREKQQEHVGEVVHRNNEQTHDIR